MRQLLPKLARLREHPAVAIVLLAALLRLAFVLVIDPSPEFGGGDTNWYMQNGRALVTTGSTSAPIQTPPLYLVFVGGVQAVIPGHPFGADQYTTTEMQITRMLQALMGAALCWFVYEIGRRLMSERVALLASLVLAVSPALIIESGILLSETLFLFLLFGGLALYVRVLPDAGWRELAAVGAILGLATLTRAVLLLFPIALFAHVLLTLRPAWRRALRLAVVMLLSYAAVVSTWTVYNLVEWDRFIVGGEGLLSFLHQGVVGQASPYDIDAGLGLDPGDSTDERINALKGQVKDTILGDPVGWASHRVKELLKAYVQPHNTPYFPGESIRDAAWDWLRDDRSPGGFVDLLGIEAFWPKLLLYVFHFGGLLLGVVGMLLLARRQFEPLVPVYGVILYFSGVHLALLALPRYLFPTYPAYWLFAAVALWWLADRWRARRSAGAH